jgi:hypothetical protein
MVQPGMRYAETKGSVMARSPFVLVVGIWSLVFAIFDGVVILREVAKDLCTPRIKIVLSKPCGARNYSKIGASFASTSSMIASGTLSSFLPLRAPRSSARG